MAVSTMLNRKTWITIIVLLLVALALLVRRDSIAFRPAPDDLRNRVVGARLIEDGRSPYFYKWEKGDSFRYYDPQNFDTLLVSNATASPVFHHLMRPLVEKPQSTIVVLWVWIEWIVFALMVAGALYLARNDYCRLAVLATAVLWLMTDSWQQHIYNGQLYLFMPFFAMLFFLAVTRPPTIFWGFITGIIACLAVLVRPNMAVFFLPWIFLLRKFSLRYWIASMVPAIAYLLILVADKQELFFWKDYRAGLDEQLKLHQSLGVTTRKKGFDPTYPVWEGIDTAQVALAEKTHPRAWHAENGNVFVVINNIFHTKISVAQLAWLGIGVWLIIAGLFYFRSIRTPDPSPAELAIMGYTLYMIIDLFSPIFRHQYYTVQWIFPVFIVAAFYRPSFAWPYLLMWVGLLLNCLTYPFIKMEHTLGEYLMLISMVSLTMQYPSKNLS